MRWAIILFVCLGAMIARGAGARHGGPSLLEVLGWEPKTHRIWMHEKPTQSGDLFGAVLFFDLDAADPDSLHDAGWLPNGAGSAGDTGLAERLKQLRRRLRPLKQETTSQLPTDIDVLTVDSLRCTPHLRRPRTLVRTRFDGYFGFEVQTYAPERGVSRSVWRIPGREERLTVLSYFGDRDEMGYEVQVPVLQRSDDPDMRQVRWRLERD